VDIQTADRLDAWPATPGQEPGGLYQSQPWLRAVERTSQPGTVRYVIAARGGQIAGLLPLYLLRPALAAYYNPRDAFGVPVDPDRPVAILGGRSGYLTGWIAAGDRVDQAATLRAMLDAAAELAAAASASSVTAQFLPPAAARLLADTGFLAPGEMFTHAADAIIALDGRSFDDYAAALTTRRRATLRADLNRFARQGLRTGITRLSCAMSFAGRLLAASSARHGGTASEASLRPMLLAQAEFLDSDSVVFYAAQPGSEPIAFSLGYVYRGVLHVRLAGFDEAAARASAAYFVTAYYEPVRYACQRGLSAVHLGIDPYRPKVIRGAGLAPLRGFVRHPAGAALDPALRRAASERFTRALLADLGDFAAEAGPVLAEDGAGVSG
jgi:uncharacterized protein